MKKEYINPVMEVVMLQSNNAILAGSDQWTETGGSGKTNESNATGPGLAGEFFDNGGSEDW